MQSDTTANGTIENWTPQEVAQAHAENRIVLIDVRTPQEYAFERISGALLLPMQEFDADHLPDPNMGKPVVFHCGSGVRSRKMAEAALAAGWDKAAHMEGGFGAWKQSGQTYIGTDMSNGAPKTMAQPG